MQLPRFSVQRPVFITMVTLIVMILGGVSLSRLPIDLLPEIALPTLSIATDYENASPEEMERLVTEVIEETVAAVPGVEEIMSRSAEGASNVRVSFTWGTDLDVASNDIRDRLDRIVDNLPEDASKPQLRKFDIAAAPILILGVSSRLDPIELTSLIENEIQYRLERIPGVAAVDTWGGFEREVQVNLDPDRLKALGLPLNSILAAIREANVTVPAGRIERGQIRVNLRTPGEFESLDQLGATVVALREGAPIRLAEIAAIDDTHREITRVVRINGDRGVRLGVRKQSGSNTVAIAERVLAEVDRINADLPQARVIPVINTGTYIERAIANVANSALYGGALAVLVLLFFLRDLRSTVVIALAIPISAIATFTLVYFGGFTLNLMTLGGLALGVGMMVDNSIVVLENVMRRRQEEREDAPRAAEHGTNEVATAIIASTLTTLVIFLPLVFLRGSAGVLFRQLAYVIAFSLLCSLLVALSVVPMLSARLLRGSGARAPRGGWYARLGGIAAGGFAWVEDGYRRLLRTALRHRIATSGAAALLLASSLALVPLLGSEFMPPGDEGEVRVDGEMAIGTRLELLDRQTRLMEEIVIASVPEAINAVVSVGAGGFNADNPEGEIRLSLTPAAQRERSNVAIAEDLRRRLEGRIPGMAVRTRAPQGQFLLNRLLDGDENLAVEIRGFDLGVLDQLADRVLAAIADVPGVTDARASRQIGGPQELIRIDRDKAADLGLSVNQVARVIQTAVAGSTAGEYREGGDEFRILVRLEKAEQLSLDEIFDLTIATPTGEDVALRNLLSVEGGRGPVEIDRQDQQRIVNVQANVAGRDLGSVAAEIEQRLDQIPLPVGYSFALAGGYEEQQEAFRELLVSLLLAVVLVYMVLACQYESLRDPLVVMFAVPFAAVGVGFMLFLTGTTLNVQSYIGCIMLGGIVVNNAILIVDQASRLRREDRMRTEEAVAEAGRRRLRPILMTTLTTVLALSPLALGIGEGAEAQAPLARAVVGGLVASTLITLVLIPVIYRFFHPEPKAVAAT